MRIDERSGKIVISSTNYEVAFVPEKLLAILQKDGFYYGMCMLSAVDTLNARDAGQCAPEISVVEKTEHAVHVTIRSDSSIWQQKICHYLFQDEQVEYWIELHGQGQVDRVYYFRGLIEGNEVASVPGFTQIFSPQANFIEKQVFHANEYTAIAAGNDENVFKSVGAFALHGAPLCFVFHDEGKPACLAAGILAKAGEYQFHAFEVNHGEHGTQALSLAYHGHLQVNGIWHTPRVRLQFGPDRFKLIENYLAALAKYGGTVKRDRPYEPWTYRPIYCTWHDQEAAAMQNARKSKFSFARDNLLPQFFAQCNQANCERWLGLLKRHGVKPGTIIIDAKWQVLAGDPFADEAKFPNLRGFVDACHADGIKVMLWFNGWDREGIPDEECIYVNGKPAHADPTNPAYRKRAAAYIRRMLSDEPGCYNADGLKVDGMTATPGGRTLKTHSGSAGFELAREFLKLLFDAAKATKEESAIGQFTACPYLADLCDIARTGDLFTIKGDSITTNAFRARIQRLVMPQVAIDTDGAQEFNYVLPFREIIEKQAEIGVPCIYQAELLLQQRLYCIPQIRPLTDDDYAAIARVWRRNETGCKTVRE